MRVRGIAVAVLVGILMLSAAGCGPSSPPELTVAPASALLDRALTIRLGGLPSGQEATLAMTTTSATGDVWTSHAVYRADSSGSVDATRAPVSGDYRGARRMGLVEALRPPQGKRMYFEAPSPWTISVAARIDGRVVGRATVTREPCVSAVRIRRLTLAHDGVLGVLAEPLHPATVRRPAVVVVGGSEGGLATTLQACLLAAHGYPSLALAYFHASGLPQDLEHVPLETFVRAAKLLAAQPHSDPGRIVLWGDSRGSEAALLTAALFPAVVHAAIGSVPNWDTAGGLPDRADAAWTVDGKDVPTGTQLPVERIAGPILLVCGEQDQVWSSCPNANLIRARLTQTHARNALTLLDYPAAGHFVGSMVPDIPDAFITGQVADGDTVVSGGTALANNEARDDAYPRLLAWLAALRRRSA